MSGLARARQRTLALVEGITEADLVRSHSPLMSPLAWDLGHIAAYEDLWLVHRHGGLELLHPELAGAYDAFETPRSRRTEVERLRPEQAREYLEAVRERTLEVMADEGVGDGHVHEMVIQHEAQHNETMLQTLGLARLDYHHPGLQPAEGPEDGDTPPAGPGRATGLELVDVPGGCFELGAPPDRFSYDNERPRRSVAVQPFRLGRTPVTNGDWVEWMRTGAYHRREWWSGQGWEARESHGLEHPGNWLPAPQEELGFGEWRIGGARPLAADHPVVHVSWFEAEAFATAHGARLPTELEWECAATLDPRSGLTSAWPWGSERGSPLPANVLERGRWGPTSADGPAQGAAPSGAVALLGDVWEWTSSDFAAYPGFRAHPYREYSEVFFDSGYKVLRGGSWATSARVITPTFRNWDLPQRRQIFAGLRLARDA
jgi:iron(II)-dependent oxidoreductase